MHMAYKFIVVLLAKLIRFLGPFFIELSLTKYFRVPVGLQRFVNVNVFLQCNAESE